MGSLSPSGDSHQLVHEGTAPPSLTHFHPLIQYWCDIDFVVTHKIDNKTTDFIKVFMYVSIKVGF